MKKDIFLTNSLCKKVQPATATSVSNPYFTILNKRLIVVFLHMWIFDYFHKKIIEEYLVMWIIKVQDADI